MAHKKGQQQKWNWIWKEILLFCIHPSRFSRVDAYKQRSIYAVGW